MADVSELLTKNRTRFTFGDECRSVVEFVFSTILKDTSDLLQHNVVADHVDPRLISLHKSITSRRKKEGKLWRNNFGPYVKDAYNANGISGIFVRDNMKTHGLHGSVISSFFSDGFAPTEVTHYSGRRSLKSLECYMNIQRILGHQQQSAIFGESFPKNNTTKTETVVANSNSPENTFSTVIPVRIGGNNQQMLGQSFSINGVNVVVKPRIK